jgi:hypothetical protein
MSTRVITWQTVPNQGKRVNHHITGQLANICPKLDDEDLRAYLTANPPLLVKWARYSHTDTKGFITDITVHTYPDSSKATQMNLDGAYPGDAYDISPDDN